MHTAFKPVRIRKPRFLPDHCPTHTSNPGTCKISRFGRGSATRPHMSCSVVPCPVMSNDIGTKRTFLPNTDKDNAIKFKQKREKSYGQIKINAYICPRKEDEECLPPQINKPPKNSLNHGNISCF